MESRGLYQVVATKTTDATGEKQVVLHVAWGAKRFRGVFTSTISGNHRLRKSGTDPLEAAWQTLIDGRTRDFSLFVSEKELTDASFTIL